MSDRSAVSKGSAPAPAFAEKMFFYLAALLLSLPITGGSASAQQDELTVVRRIETRGTVQSIQWDRITIIDDQGTEQTFAVQDASLSALALTGMERPVNFPAEVSVTGQMQINQLQPGMVITAAAPVERRRPTGPVTALQITSAIPTTWGISSSETAPATVTGRIQSLDRRRMVLTIPSGGTAAATRLNLQAADDLTATYRSDELSAVRSGDTVTLLSAIEFSNGDRVILSIAVELSREVQQRQWFSPVRISEMKYAELPTDSVPPRSVRSPRVILHTDMADRSAHVLLDQIETMLDLVSEYYGQPLTQPLEMYLVEDLQRWPIGQLPDEVLPTIRQRAGVTVGRAVGRQRSATVYAIADLGVAQHEAVHAYTFLTFGNMGPYWYAEGMAELGQYWSQDRLAVRVNPAVLAYLRQQQNHPSLDQLTGDSPLGQPLWRDYAWRWSLCHLLAHNPNYADTFRRVGRLALNGNTQPLEAFLSEFRQRIVFEHRWLLAHLQNGLRADLVAWQWEPNPSALSAGRASQVEIRADRGWQTSQVRVEQGQRVSFSTTGNWVAGGRPDPISAEGHPTGRGKLVAVMFDEYQLSEPFTLGAEGEFTVPMTGILYLRCQDDWTELERNQGSIRVNLRLAQ